MIPLPSWLSSMTLGQVVLSIAVIGVAVSAVTSAARKVWPTIKRMSEFLDDWDGPPTLPERLSTVEKKLDSIQQRLDGK